MNIPTLVATTIAVSSSGALSPGPLTLATFIIGSKYGWKGGGYVALGHTLFELPYVFSLYFFVSFIKNLLEGLVGNIITILGAGIVIYFAVMTVISSINRIKSKKHITSLDKLTYNGFRFSKNPVILGVMFTGLNIWFLIWWLSVGFELITYVHNLNLSAVFIMYLSHVWIDFVWLIIIAESGKRSTQLLGTKGYNILMVCLGVFLFLFGLNMILRRFTPISLLP